VHASSATNGSYAAAASVKRSASENSPPTLDPFAYEEQHRGAYNTPLNKKSKEVSKEKLSTVSSSPDTPSSSPAPQVTLSKSEKKKERKKKNKKRKRLALSFS